MRNIAITYSVDGVSTKINIRKVPRERRFLVIVNQIIAEYIVSDVTNEIEHHDGPELADYLFVKTCEIIRQYFPKVRAIKKIGEDNYSDYDDF